MPTLHMTHGTQRLGLAKSLLSSTETEPKSLSFKSRILLGLSPACEGDSKVRSQLERLPKPHSGGVWAGGLLRLLSGFCA